MEKIVFRIILTRSRCFHVKNLFVRSIYWWRGIIVQASMTLFYGQGLFIVPFLKTVLVTWRDRPPREKVDKCSGEGFVDDQNKIVKIFPFFLSLRYPSFFSWHNFLARKIGICLLPPPEKSFQRVYRGILHTRAPFIARCSLVSILFPT